MTARSRPWTRNGISNGAGDTDQYGINDYFNVIYENLPSAVRAFVVANASFENTSTTTGDTGVVTEPTYGNYTVGAPAGWALAGAGGTFAPNASAIMAGGHQGGNVAWLGSNGVLTQDTGQEIVEGNSYAITVNIGNRGNPTGSLFGARIELVDSERQRDRHQRRE